MIHCQKNSQKISPLIPLALGDVQANRRRVVVLEVVEASVANGVNLKRDGLASRAVKGGNQVAVAGRDAGGAVGLLDAGLVVVGGALARRAREAGEADVAGAGEGEGGGLEVLLLGEEEDEAALLALVLVGDVEVEDGGHAAGEVAKVRGAGGVVGRVLVDGDDQVGELVGAAQVDGASLGSGRRRGRLGLGAFVVAAVGPECDLLAVDAAGLEVEVELVIGLGFTRVELSLAQVGETAVAVNLEATVRNLTLVTLQGVGRSYQILLVNRQLDIKVHDILTSPPTSPSPRVSEAAILKGQLRRLDAAASSNLTARDLSDGALDGSVNTEVDLTTITAKGEGVGHGGAQGETENRRQHDER